MRTTLKFLIFLILTTSLSSCGWISGWFTEEIDTSLEGQLNLVSDQTELKSAEAYSINGQTTIDITDNDELEPYAELINDIEVNSVELRVSSVDSSGVVIDGAEFLIYTDPYNPEMRWELGDGWAVEEGTTIALTAENYSDLNDMLEGTTPVTLQSIGDCNKGNVHIVLTYDIEVVVEADPL